MAEPLPDVSEPAPPAHPPTTAPAKALVIGDDIGVFLPIVRSLGRAGICVDVATCGEPYPGLQSRYVNNVFRLPPYLKAPSAWLRGLSQLAQSEGYTLIYPSSDSSLSLLNAAADWIDRGTLAIPNAPAFEAFSDKASTRALAHSVGVPIAKGWELEAAPEALAILSTQELPLVIKPSEPYRLGRGEAKAGVEIIRSAPALERIMGELKGRRIVAESVFAGDGVGVSVLAHEGDIVSAWQHRRHAAASETGRSSQRSGERPDERLLGDVRKLAEAVSLTGVAMFEFRQDPQSGEHVLLEVNPRYWGSLPLAIAAGSDFPLLHWEMLTKGALPQGTDMQCADPQISKVSLTADFDRLSEVCLGGGQTLQTLTEFAALMLAAIFAPSRFDGWSKDDRAPHWAELAQLLKRSVAGLARRLPWSQR